MWIVNVALKRPYTFIVMAILILLATPFVLADDACRRAAGHQHSGRQHHLELHGAFGGGHRQPHHVGQRAQPDDDRQRHRAHRVAVAARHRDHQALPATDREHPDSHRADGRGRAGAVEADAAGRHAAARDQLLGVEHSGDPAWALQPEALRAGPERHRAQLPAPATRDDSRRGGALPLWRQDAPHLRRSRHARAARQGPHAVGRGERGERAEPDPADRHREDRTEGIHDQHERLARDGGGPERHSRAHAERRDHLPARSRARARRLLAADERRAAGRSSRRADLDPEERQRLDAFDRQHAA